MKREIYALGLNSLMLVALQVSVNAATASDQSFKEALDSYQKRDYKTAADLFWKSITEGNNSVTPWLYRAHCYYALKDRDNSIKNYKTVTTVFKTTREAAVASQYLKLLDPYGKWVDPSTRTSTAEQNQGSVRRLRDTIEITKSTGTHPPVGAETISTVTRAINHLPPNLDKLLTDGNAKVHITCNLVDRFPEALKMARPGLPGETLASCPGRTYGHEIWICERSVDSETNEVKETYSQESILATTLHEVGHALDDVMGVYSKSPELKKIYAQDVEAMPPGNKDRLDYFLQPGDFGPAEACAECTAKILGATGNHTSDMQDNFPRTLSFVRKKLNL